MILNKLWRTFQSQLQKVADFFWAPDPIAAMQLEYDKIVDQLREGREGLAQYRAFVERVSRQVAGTAANVQRLEATVKTYLSHGDRETAGKLALQLQQAKKDLAENQAQLRLHEQAYENNLLKIKYATSKLGVLRDKIARYEANLKLSAAEAEIAMIARDFNFDVTTDFGKVESAIQDQIDHNRARAKVYVDLSAEGVDEIRQEQAAQSQLEEDALKQFENELYDPSIPVVPAQEAAPVRRRQTETS